MTTRAKSSRASPGKTPTKKSNAPDAMWIAQFEAKIESAVRDAISETAGRIMSELTSIRESFGKIEDRLTGVERDCALVGVLRAEVLQLKADLSECEKKSVATEDKVLKMDYDRAEIEKLRTDVHALNVELSASKYLSIEVCSLRSQLDRFERAEVAADVYLHGIPAKSGEDLMGLFTNICGSMGSAVPAVTRMFRVRKSSSAKADADDPIIIKFASPKEKGIFLKSAASHNRNKRNNDKLSLRHAGFDSNAPIYFNESLTKANHALLKAALRLKKQKKISTAFTRSGRVFIKHSPTDAPVYVPTMQTLSGLVGTDGENGLFRGVS